MPRCLCPCQQKAYRPSALWRRGNREILFADCIANALLDRDVPVLMTNFLSILNWLTGVLAEDRAAFIDSLDDYSLLVIDDLGMERNTEYAMEQMFTVIDSRYRSKKPLIVTTRFSFPVRISGRKEPGRPKRRRRRL